MLASELILEEEKHLRERYGIEVEAFMQKVQEGLDENMSFIYDLMNAQETLNPKIDKELGREPIKHIIFDIGNVLLKIDDEKLANNLSQRLSVSKDKVDEAFNRLNQEAIAGRMDSETYLQKFAEILGLERVNPEDFIFPELYQSMDGMNEIVERLQQEEVDIWIYSNIIPLLVPIVRQKLQEIYPNIIDTNKILFSCEIEAAKQDAASFEKVSKIVGDGGIVFVDDVEKYTTSARIRGMRGFTFRGNPYRNISPTERLRDELKLAELI